MNFKARFEKVDYSEVLAEIERDDLDNSHIKPKLPKPEKVLHVLSDSAQVRYIIYTKHFIYVLHIDYIIQNEDEEWDLLVIPVYKE